MAEDDGPSGGGLDDGEIHEGEGSCEGEESQVDAGYVGSDGRKLSLLIRRKQYIVFYIFSSSKPQKKTFK